MWECWGECVLLCARIKKKLFISEIRNKKLEI